MSDQVVMLIRYFLIMAGSYLAGQGGLDSASVGPIVDQILQVGGGVAALGSVLWGLWAKWNTKTVTAATAARADVPTVNAATGATQF